MAKYFLLQIFPDVKHLPVWIPITEVLVMLLIGYIGLKLSDDRDHDLAGCHSLADSWLGYSVFLEFTRQQEGWR